MAIAVNHKEFISQLSDFSRRSTKFNSELKKGIELAAQRVNSTFEEYATYYGNIFVRVSTQAGFKFEFEHLKCEIDKNGDVTLYLRNYCFRGLPIPKKISSFYKGGDVSIKIPKELFGSASMDTCECIYVNIRGGWRAEIYPTHIVGVHSTEVDKKYNINQKT